MPNTTPEATATPPPVAAPAPQVRFIRFGVEIETIRRGQAECAAIIAAALGGTYRAVSSRYSAFGPDGREWRCMFDGSISNSRGDGGTCEVATPVLTMQVTTINGKLVDIGGPDLELLQKVVRALYDGGCRTNASCGIHIHVEAAPLGTEGLAKLARMVYAQESLIVAALGVQQRRLARWCRATPAALIDKLNADRPSDMEGLAKVWYGTHHGREPDAERLAAMRQIHRDGSRYHGLNLHSVWFRGTVEFRWFEACLHAGRIKAYVQLALGLVVRAIDGRCAISRKRTPAPGGWTKFDMHVLLNRLGFIGDNFRTARAHLTDPLPGTLNCKAGRSRRSRSAGAATTPDGGAPPSDQGAP